MLIWRLMRETAVRYWWRYAACILLLLVIAGSTAMIAFVIEDVVTDLLIDRDTSQAVLISLVVLGIFIAKGGSTYLSQVLLNRIGNNIIARLQRRLFRHLTSQSLAYHRQQDLGQVITRFTHATRSARDVINLLIMSLARDVLSLMALIGVMVYRSPEMSLIVLLVAPPAVLGVGLLMRYIKAIARAEVDAMGRVNSVVKETALGIQVVKAFNHDTAMISQMDTATRHLEQAMNRISVFKALTIPLMEVLAGCAIAFTIWYGAVYAAAGEPGAIFSFITAVLLAADPARRLANFNVQLQVKMYGVEILYDVLDRVPDIQDAPDAPALTVTQGRVRFVDVSFGYGGERVFDGLSVDFLPGKVNALVGPSGAGKSTILALVERFWDPADGRIEIDGQDIRRVTQRSLREQIAVVGQSTFLFDDSVRANIAVGRPGASEEEIIAAAKAANAHDFITRMPRGYDSPVGEGGGNLSGGERQRVAIARAMVRNPPILLLDEATSALDSESEHVVNEALARLMIGRTSIVIAHRLSTVIHADRIFVLEGGRVVAEGTHDSLSQEAGGLYARYVALQFGPQGQVTAS